MSEILDTFRRKPFNAPRPAIDDSQLRYWIDQLDHASKLRAGVMDSESRHLDVQRTIQMIVSSVADDIRSKL